MARPKKADDDKLVSVSTSLPPDVTAAMKRVADAKGIHLSVLIRKLLLVQFRNYKTAPAQSSLTL